MALVKKQQLDRKSLNRVEASLRSSITPIYIRLPAPEGRCAYTGLSRSALAELCIPGPRNGNRPPVKSITLPKKHKHAKRQARLIVFESLMRFLRAQEQKAA
jgi:hypothetical protein